MTEVSSGQREGSPGRVYREVLWQALPRLLGCFDRDPLSPSLGLGDRQYWAWRTQDFPNATFQGAANGLARLVAADLLPEHVDEGQILDRITQIFAGTEAILRPNGSVGEALPNENSFCVTALVAYDLLVAHELVSARLSPEVEGHWRGVIGRLMQFVRRADEHHAFITNHLATAAAALFRWSDLSQGQGEDRAQALLSRILDRQSEEGWFPEYGGADPGYQSLAYVYFADIHARRPSERLSEALGRGLVFLQNFAHPDGSFGGLYGSRGTRFLMPGGIEALARDFPSARPLAAFARESVAGDRFATLRSVDDPNLVPFYNSYAMAAQFAQQLDERLPDLPCRSLTPFQRHFREAGLVVHRGATNYTVVSTHKGGLVYHFSQGQAPEIDPGLAATDRYGRVFTTQMSHPGNEVEVEAGRVRVAAGFLQAKQQLPTPFQFIVLRLIALTLFRSLRLADMTKVFFARYLFGTDKRARGTNVRTIEFGANLVVHDDRQNLDGLRVQSTAGAFRAMTMASQGYWQRQDDDPR